MNVKQQVSTEILSSTRKQKAESARFTIIKTMKGFK